MHQPTQEKVQPVEREGMTMRKEHSNKLEMEKTLTWKEILLAMLKSISQMHPQLQIYQQVWKSEKES